MNQYRKKIILTDFINNFKVMSLILICAVLFVFSITVVTALFTNHYYFYGSVAVFITIALMSAIITLFAEIL